MGEKVTTSISIDPAVRREATEVFEEIGIGFSAGIEVYLRTVARERRIPFEIDLTRDMRGHGARSKEVACDG